MSYKFHPTELFISEAKKLKKKYPNLKEDLENLRDSLKKDPITSHDSLGANCYKVRMELKDKPGGKSGGARVIIQVYVQDKMVHLLSIYDKSNKNSLYEGELDKILKKKILAWGKKNK
jgi:mRNA-degrading endonuclease RelE of RelBE toxin-antitoxin system